MDLNIYPNVDELIDAITNAIVDTIHRTVENEGICSILLSGGSTPLPLYRRMANELASEIPWDRIHLFWADERFVPRDNAASNFGVASKIFENVGLSRAQIHPIPVRYETPEESATAYEHELRLWSVGNIPHFDITLLGIGDDGHTASLFPGDAGVSETERLVVAAASPSVPKQRISVTLPVLNASKSIHFLVSGQSKAKALKQILEPSGGPQPPAALVQSKTGTTSMWIDAPAASLLSSSNNK